MMWDHSSTSWNHHESPLPRNAGAKPTERGEHPVTESPSSGTQALDRAVQLASMVVQADEPVSFADLQEATGLAKSTTSRLLAALERGDLLERDDNGGYVAGSLFWLYAARHDPWEQLVQLARPAMERVGSDTQETVHLSVIRGDQVVQVAQVDSQYLLGTRDWTQVDVPAHTSALGKVFLAWGALDPSGMHLARLTPQTLTTAAALRRDGATARRRGYAVTVDELEDGLTGIAVPVLGPHGELVAALGISGPTSRLDGRVEELGRNLITRAAEVAAVQHAGNHLKPKKEGAA
jgi:DNA-binding IclR family transcriptional regulator